MDRLLTIPGVELTPNLVLSAAEQGHVAVLNRFLAMVPDGEDTLSLCNRAIKQAATGHCSGLAMLHMLEPKELITRDRERVAFVGRLLVVAGIETREAVEVACAGGSWYLLSHPPTARNQGLVDYHSPLSRHLFAIHLCRHQPKYMRPFGLVYRLGYGVVKGEQQGQ
eukprot:TRINITY_DN7910_c0_g1_i2.p1 TRINITY_DN7910_c0_g1~~TRINITY_DN7910_c0_g1_i2.p1  ORF type:complete len:167 (-),score=12.03 TRINITY_DN7910_c0_g1_i2:359-859(-)